MSGRDKAAENRQNAYAEKAQANMDKYTGLGDTSLTTGQAYQNPVVNHYLGLINGDPNSIISNSSVPLANLTKQYKQARENVFDSTGSGAAREFALSGMERQRAGDTASILNQGYKDALGFLYQAGQDQKNLGLQEVGAGMRSGESASQVNQQLMQVAQQRKASQLGLLGQVAGIAGNVVTGGLMGGGSSGGGGFMPSTRSASDIGFNIPGTPPAISYLPPSGVPSYIPGIPTIGANGQVMR